MSTAILPDDSVVVRMPTHTVHVDASAKAIHVREPSPLHELGGIIRATFPLQAADRIRLMTARTGKQHLCLDLSSGETLDLGEVPSAEVAMVTARAIADLTRCKIEVAQGMVANLPGPSVRFSEGETYGSPLSISPESAERMFQVCEALMESQDGVEAPPIPEPHALIPGDTRTVEMTRDEAERVMGRSLSPAAPAPDGAAPVMPSDLEEDESDQPTVTPSAPADGLSSTDRERPIEEVIGVDGLAQTIADRPISDLNLFASSGTTSASTPDTASTQPDRPLPAELFVGDTASGMTQPEMPAPGPFEENTELDDAAIHEPIFMDLLRESQSLAAKRPSVGTSRDGSDETDLQKTAEPEGQSPEEAVVEMLRLTVEALPEASVSLADDD